MRPSVAHLNNPSSPSFVVVVEWCFHVFYCHIRSHMHQHQHNTRNQLVSFSRYFILTEIERLNVRLLLKLSFHFKHCCLYNHFLWVYEPYLCVFMLCFCIHHKNISWWAEFLKMSIITFELEFFKFCSATFFR